MYLRLQTAFRPWLEVLFLLEPARNQFDSVWKESDFGRSPFFIIVKFLKILSVCLVAMLAAKAAVIEIKDRIQNLAQVPPTNYHPDLLIVRFGTLGYGSAISSTLWLNTILTYADVLFEGRPGKGLLTDFALVSELDTNWAHPSLIAAWAIPQVGGYTSKDVLPMLERGANRFPNEWKFRLTWAQYVLDARDIDSAKARDSAATILLPLSASTAEIPQYARNLAFTLLHKNGRPEEAMSLLLQTYEQVPDPMVRLQFREKIGDLLQRNHVSLGADSADFLGGIGSLLESKDVADHAMAGRVLTGLVDTVHRVDALVPARQLAGQFRSYRAAGAK